jgi:hypothetical protein
MSLGNISQPSVKYCAEVVNAKYTHGRPGPELVPSRYAFHSQSLSSYRMIQSRLFGA